MSNRYQQGFLASILAVLAATLAACGGPNVSSVRVVTYDLNNWGVAAAADAQKVSIVSQVIARSELAMIQGVNEVGDTAIQALLTDLNASDDGTWSLTAGARVGRTASKEQYVLFYRSDLFDLIEKLEFTEGSEPATDAFEREPLMLHLGHIESGAEVGLILFKAKPTDVVAELDALPDVVSHAEAAFGTSRLVLGGNFSADCAYLSNSAYDALELVSGVGASGWTWQSSRTQDTTSGATDCGYTHLLTKDELTTENVVSAAEPLDIMTAFGIDQATATGISPHLPVELDLEFEVEKTSNF